MKEKGFVTSALLYGILSVYIVLVVGTKSVIGNRKLASDKIKQSAIDDVQYLETDLNCFTTEDNGNGDSTVYIKEYTCSEKNVFIPEKDKGGNVITTIGPEAFKDKNIETITIKPNIKDIYCNAFNGNDNIYFIIKGTINPNETPCKPNTKWGATDFSIRYD